MRPHHDTLATHQKLNSSCHVDFVSGNFADTHKVLGSADRRLLQLEGFFQLSSSHLPCCYGDDTDPRSWQLAHQLQHGNFSDTLDAFFAAMLGFLRVKDVMVPEDLENPKSPALSARKSPSSVSYLFNASNQACSCRRILPDIPARPAIICYGRDSCTPQKRCSSAQCDVDFEFAMCKQLLR
jgi:hypothetical protein